MVVFVVPLFYPIGIIKIWRVKGWLAAEVALFHFWFCFFLVGLRLSGNRHVCFVPSCLRSHRRYSADKTVYNTEGNYSATFLKSGNETNGAYELVQVELEPFGGNDWHYHKSFREEFTVLEGQVKIGRNGQELLLNKGESAAANHEDMHFFKNATRPEGRVAGEDRAGLRA